MKKLKFTISLLLTAVILLSALPSVAFANSALLYLDGADRTGAVVLVPNDALKVEKEILTFDVNEFPLSHYESKEDFFAYSGMVTAEYHFFNDSDATITAKLAFPFGSRPHYAYYDENGNWFEDLDRYKITVDGEEVQRKVRHTYSSPYDNFFLSDDLPRLKDGYTEHEFFTPDMTVTKYVFNVSVAENRDSGSARVALKWDTTDKSRKIYVEKENYLSVDDNGIMEIGSWVRYYDNEIFEFYVFGDPLKQTPQLTFFDYFKDGKREIEGKATLRSQESMTFEQFAFANFEEGFGISRIDWYNGVIDSIEEHSRSSWEEGVVSIERALGDFENFFMRWYEYEITLEPNGRLVNTVQAPIYPRIDQNYEPIKYTYSYLLSPATTFGDFKNLEVHINTPYYLCGYSIDQKGEDGAQFTKTETGYYWQTERLPEGELYLSLSTSETPEYIRRTSAFEILLIFLVAFAVIGCLSILAAIVLAIAVLVKRKKRKQRSPTEN